MPRLKKSLQDQIDANAKIARDAADVISRAVNADDDDPDYIEVRGASYWNAVPQYRPELAKSIVVQYTTPDAELAHRVAYAVALAVHQYRSQQREEAR